MHKKLFLAVICLAVSGSMKACGGDWFFKSNHYASNNSNSCCSKPFPIDIGSRFLITTQQESPCRAIARVIVHSEASSSETTSSESDSEE